MIKRFILWVDTHIADFKAYQILSIKLGKNNNKVFVLLYIYIHT
jgi:hypothetical protein